MKKYYENFNLVELNTTFYQYPRMETVEGWRKKAPETFEFTVKAHQEISHKEKMKLSDACLQAFEKMKEICEILNSKILLIQTPGSFKPDKLEDARNFFKKADRKCLAVVWETRGPPWETSETREKLRKVLEEVNVSHVTDPFRASPAYVGEIAYFRVHGLGERMYYYQYSDAELRRLFDLVKPYDEQGKSVYVLFNNLAMFDDARRFLTFLKSGKFPKLTADVGLDSVKEILAKVCFPISKSVLVKRFGWRLAEVRDGEQVKLESLFNALPSKSFASLNELLMEIEAKIKV